MAFMWLVSCVAATAGDWPHYRGPNDNGISAEADWSADWGDSGPKILWSASVGKGSSSVVVAKGRAYTMGNQGETEADETDTVCCFNAVTGKVIWTHSYPYTQPFDWTKP